MDRKTSIATLAAALLLVPWAASAQPECRPHAFYGAQSVEFSSVKRTATRAGPVRHRVLRSRPVSLPVMAIDIPISVVQPDNYKYWGQARSGGW